MAYLDAVFLLFQLSNHLFEELAMDVYDEVDRRENDSGWYTSWSALLLLFRAYVSNVFDISTCLSVKLDGHVARNFFVFFISIFSHIESMEGHNERLCAVDCLTCPSCLPFDSLKDEIFSCSGI